jgi:homospermidine synthase
MINIVIDDARVSRSPTKQGWYVYHPCNDAILAYCDTEAEAKAVCEAINDMARVLRAVGEKVK